MFKRFSLRLRLTLSIILIVVMFTMTNITYQINSNNRTQRLNNLQNMVQGQLSINTFKQALSDQQQQILVIEALSASDETQLNEEEKIAGQQKLQELDISLSNLSYLTPTAAEPTFKELTVYYDNLNSLYSRFFDTQQTSNKDNPLPVADIISEAYLQLSLQIDTYEKLLIDTAETRADELQTTSKLNDRLTIAIYLVTILLTVSLGFLLIRYTHRSLMLLNQGTVKIGDGDLDYTIPATGNDEIGDLAIAFNSMAEKLKNAMAQVQQSKEKADRANRAKTDFLANMSHELRTPLNAIIGYSEILIEDFDDEENIDKEQATRDLTNILSSGRHLLQLINDVLDLAKIESGNMGVFNENFDSVEIIEDIIEKMAPIAKKNQNKLEVTASGQIPTLFSDTTKFRQIFLNLLSNACKFTENGKVSVQVNFDTEKEEIIYHVNDTGIGMTEKELSYVFNAFVQADSSTSKQYGGTGLGLAICKQFIDLMKGQLDVSSASGYGTTFTVKLPIRPETVKAEPPRAIPTKNQQEFALSQPGISPTNVSTATAVMEQHSDQSDRHPSPLHQLNAPNNALLVVGNSSLPEELPQNSFSTHPVDSSEFISAIPKRAADNNQDNHNPIRLRAICFNLYNELAAFTKHKITIESVVDVFSAPQIINWNSQYSSFHRPANEDDQPVEKSLLSAKEHIENRARLASYIRQKSPSTRRGNALIVYANNSAVALDELKKVQQMLKQEVWQTSAHSLHEKIDDSVKLDKTDIVLLAAPITYTELAEYLTPLESLLGSKNVSFNVPIYLLGASKTHQHRLLDQPVIELY